MYRIAHRADVRVWSFCPGAGHVSRCAHRSAGEFCASTQMSQQRPGGGRKARWRQPLLFEPMVRLVRGRAPADV